MDERPRKRVRLSFADDLDDDDDDAAAAAAAAAAGPSLAEMRRENDRILAERLDDIFDKYSYDFDGISDVIDLATNEVVEDNGHVRLMRDEYDAGRPRRPPSSHMGPAAAAPLQRTASAAINRVRPRSTRPDRVRRNSHLSDALSVIESALLGGTRARGAAGEAMRARGAEGDDAEMTPTEAMDDSNEWEEVEDTIEDSDVEAEDILSSPHPSPAPRRRQLQQWRAREGEPRATPMPAPARAGQHSPAVLAIAQVVAELLPMLSQDSRIQQHLGLAPQHAHEGRSATGPPPRPLPTQSPRSPFSSVSRPRAERNRGPPPEQDPEHYVAARRSVWAPKRRYVRRTAIDTRESDPEPQSELTHQPELAREREPEAESSHAFRTNWSRQEDQLLLNLARDVRYQRDNKPWLPDIASQMPRRREEVVARRLERLMCDAVLREAAAFAEMDTGESQAEEPPDPLPRPAGLVQQMLEYKEMDTDAPAVAPERKSSRKKKRSDRASWGISWAEVDLDSDTMLRSPEQDRPPDYMEPSPELITEPVSAGPMGAASTSQTLPAEPAPRRLLVEDSDATELASTPAGTQTSVDAGAVTGPAEFQKTVPEQAATEQPDTQAVPQFVAKPPEPVGSEMEVEMVAEASATPTAAEPVQETDASTAATSAAEPVQEQAKSPEPALPAPQPDTQTTAVDVAPSAPDARVSSPPVPTTESLPTAPVITITAAEPMEVDAPPSAHISPPKDPSTPAMPAVVANGEPVSSSKGSHLSLEVHEGPAARADTSPERAKKSVDSSTSKQGAKAKAKENKAKETKVKTKAPRRRQTLDRPAPKPKPKAAAKRKAKSMGRAASPRTTPKDWDDGSADELA